MAIEQDLPEWLRDRTDSKVVDSIGVELRVLQNPVDEGVRRVIEDALRQDLAIAQERKLGCGVKKQLRKIIKDPDNRWYLRHLGLG